MIAQLPAGASHGQQIDPAVFRDPGDGKYYLYWGNQYLAAAALSDDMLSIKEGHAENPDARQNLPGSRHRLFPRWSPLLSLVGRRHPERELPCAICDGSIATRSA